MTDHSFETESKSILPPKDDPIPLSYLSQCDGSNEGFPVYVAIKGMVFDVTPNRASYDPLGPGGSYHVFAGKDGSRGLGKSSLKEEDATADYSDLNESELQTLEKWVDFFSKKYNIVGKVVQD